MKGTRIFLGIVVILIGVLWLLSNFNLITVFTLTRLWRYWPLFLILWGLLLLLDKNSSHRTGWLELFFLLGAIILVIIVGIVVIFSPWFSYFSHEERHALTFNNTIDNIYTAERMRLVLNLHSGDFRLHAHSGEHLVKMQIQAPREPKITHKEKNNLAEITIEDQQQTLKVNKNVSRWDFSLSKDLPAEIILHTGATNANLDLTELEVEKLEVHTGAGDLTVKLPQVNSEFEIHSGAANLLIYIPHNVGVRLKADGALLSVDGKNSRVVSVGDRMYESSELEEKEAIIDLYVAAAAGRISLRSL